MSNNNFYLISIFLCISISSWGTQTLKQLCWNVFITIHVYYSNNICKKNSLSCYFRGNWRYSHLGHYDNSSARRFRIQEMGLLIWQLLIYCVCINYYSFVYLAYLDTKWWLSVGLELNAVNVLLTVWLSRKQRHCIYK